MNKSKLIIMVGNIASGKTSWVKNYLATKSAEELKNWVVLSKNDLRRMIGAGNYIYDKELEPTIHSNILGIIHDYMTINVNIIYDETNENTETRKPFLSLTKKYHRLGYEYEMIAVVMPKTTKEHAIKCRCGNKDSAWGFSASTWREVWQRKNDKFEMPTKEEERFDEIWRLNNG